MVFEIRILWLSLSTWSSIWGSVVTTSNKLSVFWMSRLFQRGNLLELSSAPTASTLLVEQLCTASLGCLPFPTCQCTSMHPSPHVLYLHSESWITSTMYTWTGLHCQPDSMWSPVSSGSELPASWTSGTFQVATY